MFPGFGRLVVYPVEAIFGDEMEPDTLRFRRARRRANAKKAAPKAEGKTETGATPGAEAAAEGKPSEAVTLADVEKLERECGPFQNGKGNPQYLRLIRAYRRAGVSQSEAVDRLKGILARSPGYVGDIRTGLEARVAASYRKLKGPAEGIGLESAALRRDRHAMAFVTMVIDDLGMKNAQERAAAERFLLKLWAWKEYLDGKMKRPEEAWAWDFENPRFRRMMAEGYYPLPSKLLRTMAARLQQDYQRAKESWGDSRESLSLLDRSQDIANTIVLNLRRMQMAGSVLGVTGTLTITRAE